MTTNLDEMESAAREMARLRDAAYDDYDIILSDDDDDTEDAPVDFVGRFRLRDCDHLQFEADDPDVLFIVAARDYAGPEHVLALLARVRELEAQVEQRRILYEV
jgi:hypothetical protein